MAKPLQHQIVARALELISDEAQWTRGFVARRADGRLCACFDPRAARFCAVGALNRAARELVGVVLVEHAYVAEGFVLAANGRHHDSLSRINDNDGHEVIVAMFKVALAH
jgi:hypothetical protein